MRKFLIPVAAVVAVAVLALAARWAFFSDPDAPGDVVANPTATPTVAASPSATATPQPSPPVEGAIPVPAFPASAIPWDEVGPGWFLLTYDPDWTDDVVPEQTTGEFGPQYWFSLADESVMLVSPAGGLYYVRSLAGMGSVRTMEWTGESVLLLEGHATADSDEVPHGRLDALDLATGVATTLNEDRSGFDEILATLADGRIVLFSAGWEGYEWVEYVSPNFAFSGDLCGATFGAISTLSPDGTRVVCLEEDYPKSAVMLYTVMDGSGVMIDQFKYDPWNYVIGGWWDANSFVLSRIDETTQANLWWAYDVSTQTLRDLNAVLADGTPAEFARGDAGYRIVRAGPIVEVHGFDGVLRASVACDPSAISGSVALTICPAPAGESLLQVSDLESGESTDVGSFVQGPETELYVYPWPH